MALDILAERSLAGDAKELGFDRVFVAEKNRVVDHDDPDAFEFSMYSGDDPENAIKKGKFDLVTDLDKSGFLLNKGLCSKLKERGITVVFKFSSLLEAEDMFRVYKNMLINIKVCNEYSIPVLFVSFAKDNMGMKSPVQLEAFAEQFGYNYKNYRKAEKLFVDRS